MDDGIVSTRARGKSQDPLRESGLKALHPSPGAFIEIDP